MEIRRRAVLTGALTVGAALAAPGIANAAAPTTVRAFGVEVVRRAGWGADESFRFDANGDDTMPVFQGRKGNGPRMSNGAHVGGFNAGNVGICLLGDFTATQPTQAARMALVKTLAGLAHLTGLDPLGTTNYVNPISGATKTVPAIAAHREWSATACPGDAFYPHLPGVRQDVAAYLERLRREHS